MNDSRIVMACANSDDHHVLLHHIDAVAGGNHLRMVLAIHKFSCVGLPAKPPNGNVASSDFKDSFRRLNCVSCFWEVFG